MFRLTKVRAAVAAGAVAVAVTTAAVVPAVSGAGATTKSPVSAWVMAWRQTGGTLLVAYKARNNTTVEQKDATCHVHAKPSVSIPSPYYYTLSPYQTFTLRKATSHFTYIGAFTLPKLPPNSHISHVWVSCR
ncbi:MAG TPA: hypothetical protein VKU92_02775 [Acidimicrobiales bacterium]|nr:hypothetical protein [Acidimicrobiales bacterium]